MISDLPGFKTDLNMYLKTKSNNIFILDAPLVYNDEIFGKLIVPKGFETDLASVPRIPVIYALYGGRVHREAVLHDALYRKDFPGKISFWEANCIFLRAMNIRKIQFCIRFPMFSGVCMGGYFSFHKRKMKDKL